MATLTLGRILKRGEEAAAVLSPTAVETPAEERARLIAENEALRKAQTPRRIPAAIKATGKTKTPIAIDAACDAIVAASHFVHPGKMAAVRALAMAYAAQRDVGLLDIALAAFQAEEAKAERRVSPGARKRIRDAIIAAFPVA